MEIAEKDGFSQTWEARFEILSCSAFKCATACLLSTPTPSNDPWPPGASDHERCTGAKNDSYTFLATAVENSTKIMSISLTCALSHADEFQVPCQLIFFPNLRHRGACDGIGGTAKRATYRENLQRTVSDQILTAQNMYDFQSQQFVSVI